MVDGGWWIVEGGGWMVGSGWWLGGGLRRMYGQLVAGVVRVCSGEEQKEMGMVKGLDYHSGSSSFLSHGWNAPPSGGTVVGSMPSLRCNSDLSSRTSSSSACAMTWWKIGSYYI